MRMLVRGYDIVGKTRDNFFQLIAVDNLFKDLNFSSKLNASWEFLSRLRTLGQEAAEAWLKKDLALVGKATSPLIKKMFSSLEEDWFEEMVHKPAKHLKEYPIGTNGRQELKSHPL